MKKNYYCIRQCHNKNEHCYNRDTKDIHCYDDRDITNLIVNDLDNDYFNIVSNDFCKTGISWDKKLYRYKIKFLGLLKSNPNVMVVLLNKLPYQITLDSRINLIMDNQYQLVKGVDLIYTELSNIDFDMELILINGVSYVHFPENKNNNLINNSNLTFNSMLFKREGRLLKIPDMEKGVDKCDYHYIHFQTSCGLITLNPNDSNRKTSYEDTILIRDELKNYINNNPFNKDLQFVDLSVYDSFDDGVNEVYSYVRFKFNKSTLEIKLSNQYEVSYVSTEYEYQDRHDKLLEEYYNKELEKDLAIIRFPSPMFTNDYLDYITKELKTGDKVIPKEIINLLPDKALIYLYTKLDSLYLSGAVFRTKPNSNILIKKLSF